MSLRKTSPLSTKAPKTAIMMAAAAVMTRAARARALDDGAACVAHGQDSSRILESRNTL